MRILEKLKSIIQYTGVSDCKMEEGSLRCDANISLRPVGQEEVWYKSRVKKLKLIQLMCEKDLSMKKFVKKKYYYLVE